jgi:small subunit ribosomal protein S4
MIRKSKKYSRPKKLYIKERIKSENELVKKYGLKNKKEIWKAQAKINYLRGRAMALARASPEEQKVLFDKLNRIGLVIENTADVLALETEKLLARRLPSIVFKKGLSKTPQEARQMVVHKRVSIEDKIVNVPSYIVAVEEESKIKLKSKAKKKDVKKEESEEKVEEMKENGEESA